MRRFEKEWGSSPQLPSTSGSFQARRGSGRLRPKGSLHQRLLGVTRWSTPRGREPVGARFATRGRGGDTSGGPSRGKIDGEQPSCTRRQDLVFWEKKTFLRWNPLTPHLGERGMELAYLLLTAAATFVGAVLRLRTWHVQQRRGQALPWALRG